MVLLYLQLLLLAFSFNLSVLYNTHAQGCQSESFKQREAKLSSYPNIRFNGATIQVLNTSSQLICIHRCLRHCECFSVNVKEILNGFVLCEMIKAKVTFSEEKMVSAQGWMHYFLKVAQPDKQKTEKTSGDSPKAPYKNCAEALLWNNNLTTAYQIRPGDMQDIFTINCEMRSDGVAMTVFHHDRESTQHVSGQYLSRGAIKHPLEYNVSIGTVKKFVDLAVSCRQYTYARCLAVSFVGRGYCWLSDRNGATMRFWGGGPSNGEGCACGVGTSCANPVFLCNCDSKLSFWGQDEGYVTKKNLLPITMMSLGDVHDMYYYIGKLECADA